MATNTLDVRVINATLTASEWGSCKTIPMKGELCIESDTLKMKMGDGVKPFSALGYMYLTQNEIKQMVDNGAFVLKAATAQVLGGVKIGANVNVAGDGTISVKDGSLTQKGLVQLSSDTASVSETVAATPKAVKAAYDLANGKAPAVHSHDDKYYTETEVDGFLAGKADAIHNHDDKYYTEAEINAKVEALNTSINAKQNVITGAATTITDKNLTADKVLISDASGKVAASAVTKAELGHLSGVTSAIQTQLNAKSSTGHKHTKSEITDFPTSMPASDVKEWAKAATKPTYTAGEVGAIAATAKGAKNGVASLDANGLVPTSQLPSYVDDVLEGTYVNGTTFNNPSGTAYTAEAGKIYVDTKTNITYRWSGSAYIEISKSLSLGTTSSSAFRGDYGQIAYTHSQSAHVTGVKGDKESTYRTGQVNITPANIGAAAASHTHNYAGSASAGGAANSAVKLANARSFSITGAATADAVSFTGEANVALNVSKLNAVSLYLNAGDSLVLNGASAFTPTV